MEPFDLAQLGAPDEHARAPAAREAAKARARAEEADTRAGDDFLFHFFTRRWCTRTTNTRERKTALKSFGLLRRPEASE